MNYRERKSQQKNKVKICFWIATAICLVATLVYLQTRLWVVDLSYEFNNLEHELAVAKKENARLRVEVGRLKSPARIEKIAREQLALKSREDLKQPTPVIFAPSKEIH